MKKPKLPGVIGGLGITFKTMMKPAVTVQYPHEREDPPTRARGVIALKPLRGAEGTQTEHPVAELTARVEEFLRRST